MNRPKLLHVGGTLFWVLRTRNPDTQVLKDADSTPTVVIRKNGASTGDSVTVTKRSATTGIYDCSYNPAGEVEGDEFTVEETAVVTGTTTTQATYSTSWEFAVLAVERGTDNAALAATALSTSVWTSEKAGFVDAAISTRSTFAGGAVASVSGNVGGNVLGSVGSVVAAVELDSFAAAKLARIEAVVSGTLSGAGTDTETFVGPSATVVITVDASGNRSNVSVT